MNHNKMYRKKPSKKDKPDSEPYVIHRGSLPTIDELRSGIIIHSYDPATDNFACRVEWRNISIVTTVTMGKVKFNADIDTNRSKTLYSDINAFLMKIPLLDKVRLVIIERQLPINTAAVRISQQTLAFYLNLTNPNICVIEINPTTKTKALKAPKGMNDTYIKKWAVWMAQQLLYMRNDGHGLTLMEACGKKLDDVADTTIQPEALFVSLGMIDIPLVCTGPPTMQEMETWIPTLRLVR